MEVIFNALIDTKEGDEAEILSWLIVNHVKMGIIRLITGSDRSDKNTNGPISTYEIFKRAATT